VESSFLLAVRIAENLVCGCVFSLCQLNVSHNFALGKLIIVSKSRSRGKRIYKNADLG